MKVFDNKMNLKLMLMFIPVAYFSFFFHEFGHWVVGEILGNEMGLRLNGSSPISGQYLENSQLYILCGGVGFTLLLTIISWFIIEKYKVIYAYPIVFFNSFMRIVPQIIKFDFQDEAKISALAGIGKYTIAIIVIFLLLFIVWRTSRVLKLNYKDNILCFIASIICTFLVVITDYLLFYNFYHQP